MGWPVRGKVAELGFRVAYITLRSALCRPHTQPSAVRERDPWRIGPSLEAYFHSCIGSTCVFKRSQLVQSSSRHRSLDANTPVATTLKCSRYRICP